MLCADLYAQSICSYRYRKRITFNASQVGGSNDLQNFQALINISSDNDLRTTGNGGHVSSASGHDIVFTASDGVTLLDFQRESYSATSGQFVAWVRLPVLSASLNTIIYMYYGNATATDQSTSSIWSGYDGVWHLGGGSIADNSPNGYNCTNNGSSNLAAAKIGGGRSFDGNDWLEVSSGFPNKNTNFTISGWVYTNNNAQPHQRIFCDDVNNSGGYALSVGDGGVGMLRFYSRGSTNIILDAPLNTISSNTWHYCVGVADISNNVRRLYVNGVQVASVTSVGWGIDNGNCSIGGETAAGETGNRINGRLDEVRVANSALSAEWILTEYRNQNSPSTFYSISPEPDMWDGSSSTAWNTNANWAANAVPGAGDDVIIDVGTNQPALNTNIQIGSLWIRPGATLTLNTTRTLSVRYDITNCGVIVGAGTSALQLNATSSHIQNQMLSGSGTYNLRNLTINNTFAGSASVTLNQSVTVNANLNLVAGVLVTGSTNILAMENTATSSSGSANSYVHGPMTKTGTSAFVFPVGKNGVWRRLGISAPSASSTFRAEYFNSAYSNTSSVNSPLNNVSLLEHWQLDRLSGSGNSMVSLFWEDASASGINNCADLTIARWNGSAWIEHPATTEGSSSCAGTGAGTVTTNANVTAFSPFSFGSKTSAFNALPVELLGLEATCINKNVELRWKTATERNNAAFVIESSIDGISWHLAGSVAGAGNSFFEKNYRFVHSYKVGFDYYRLVQVDGDGRRTIFDPLFVECETESQQFFTLFPNPATDKLTVKINGGSAADHPELVITDQLGRVSQSVILGGKGIYTISLELKPGVYFVELKTRRQSSAPQRLIVE